jgi:ribose transport system substrate-binding protein
MKKFLTLIIGLILFSCLAFATGGKKVLGVLTPNATHGFTGESIQHARAAAEELSKKEGFEYKFLTSAESSEQNNQIDGLINEKVDAIVLWPHNGNELRSAAIKVTEAKIPLIIYDRLIDGFAPTAEVMGDNVTIGQLAGKYFSKFFAEDLKKGKVNILEFKGDNSTVPQQRSDGFKETADKNFVVVQQFSTDWQRAKAREQMENFLNNVSKEEVESVKAIFTHDDEVALGIIDAIIAYTGNKKINVKLISGVSGSKDLLVTFDSLLKDKGISQVTYLFSPSMVRDAVKMGADILNGKPFHIEKAANGQYLIPTAEVDNNNYKEFQNSEVYKVRYSL